MRFIQTKGSCPEILTRWIKQHPGSRYGDLPLKMVHDLRAVLFKEQEGLCAYCCGPTTVNDSRSSHIVAQRVDPKRTLDWSNLVCSCSNPFSCDILQGEKPIPITPPSPRCESEISFSVDGKVAGRTPDAETTIKNLGLDSCALTERRRNAILSYIFAFELNPLDEAIELYDDEDDFNCLIKSLLSPSSDGTLSPYAPVIANVLRSLHEKSRNRLPSQPLDIG